MGSEGKLIQRYRKTKGALCAWLFILALALTIGLLPWWLPVRMTDEIRRLQLQCLAPLLLLVVLFAKSAWDSLGGPVYEACENGIRKVGPKGSETFLPYADMADVFQFTTGRIRGLVNNTAFRKHPTDPWELISAHYRGAAVHGWLVSYVQQRCEALWRRLQEGEEVAFRYTTTARKRVASAIALSPASIAGVRTSELHLGNGSFTVSGRSHPLTNLQPVRMVAPGEFAIQTRGGDEVFRFRAEDVFSSEVFLSLYNLLTRQRGAASSPGAASGLAP